MPASIIEKLKQGVDFWVCETFLHAGEALIALERAKKTGLPVMVTLAWEGPKTRDGKGLLSGSEESKQGCLLYEGPSRARRDVSASSSTHPSEMTDSSTR